MTEIAKIDRNEIAPQESSAGQMVQLIERLVMSPDVPLDKLEKMLDMQERMEERAARKAYDQAMADAKSEIRPIVKDGRVNYTKDGKTVDYQHETLAGIAQHVDPILAKYGLSYRYRSDMLEGGVLRVTCIVSHRDGYSEETALEGSRDQSGSKNNFQGMGSAATYLQRYTLKLALGLSAAKDDDASSAVAKTAIDEEQYRRLRKLIEEANADEDALKKFLGHTGDLIELPSGKMGAAEKMLRQKIRKMQAEKDNDNVA